MVFAPAINGGAGSVIDHRDATYFDSLYENNGNYISTINLWRQENPSASIGEVYSSSQRELLMANEDGFRTGFELGWWNAEANALGYSGVAIGVVGMTVNPTNENDEIIGTSSDDVLYMLSGDDVVDGGDGEDFIDGGDGNDHLIGGKWAFKDIIYGGNGDDFIGGGGGPDMLYGEAGNDEIRAGHGKDIITGGTGADILYGGGGGNVFESELDGSVDNLYIMSDFRGHGFEWGRNHGGINADIVKELDVNDRITILGTSQSDLSFRDVAAGTFNQSQAGIGIFDGEMLEALYVGTSLNSGQLAAITTADSSRFW